VTKRINVTEVIKEYGKKLSSFIRKRVNSVEDSEDILQEVFVQLAEADRMMKPIDQISGWLFTVARNRITDLYRKKKIVKDPGLISDEESDYEMEELSQMLLYTGDSPEDQYLQSLIRDEFEAALSELPPEQRQVFELNELLDIPFKEIAIETGETVNTLLSRKHYAVLYLRKRLQYLYNEIINN
jgi:RNA polymerase sigma factor (sigma-70 family)